ncbi:hypothetical protein PIB30_041399 [Stylosanthes scabra]|uniref:Uncharacterized protein n=1 Tax=Stylosanthes scabra TaxID=79078 RepID=A0ABU6SFN7_9FABA|nr:hypothetical protein [Stylosanthes scabra]
MAYVLCWSPERGPLQQQVLGSASKRADSGAQSLEPAGGWTYKATLTLKSANAGCKEVTKALLGMTLLLPRYNALTPEKERKSKEKTRQNVGIISVLPHSGNQCSGLVTEKRSSSGASTRQGFKEGGFRCSELGTGRGWTCKATPTLKSTKCIRES